MYRFLESGTSTRDRRLIRRQATVLGQPYCRRELWGASSSIKQKEHLDEQALSFEGDHNEEEPARALAIRTAGRGFGPERRT